MQGFSATCAPHTLPPLDTLTKLGSALADRYTIARELGAGGMATVYLAHDLKHDRDVAIKVLHPDLGAALGGERFLSEIKTTAKLQHPHILPLLDSGEADGLLYYVMPVVGGETLRAYLERVQQLPIPEAVRITREVASALDYAHRQNVIHRDIKPENILLHDGSALVADFGIALAVQSAGGQRMTQTGLSLGTPQYMSPEQAMGEKHIDARADVYALGAMAYEMLTGDAPFTGTTVQAIVAKVLTAEPERPSLVRKTIPPHVEAAVLTALAKLPADRFATAAEFGAALGNTGYEATLSSVRPRAAASRSDRRLLAALSVVALMAIGIGAWGWMRRAPSASVLRYEMQLPAVMRGVAAEDPLPLPSPDGSFMIFAGPRAGRVAGAQLWMKRRESRSAIPIPGTVDAQSYTLSPDGAWIAFVNGEKLVKVPVAGGVPVTLVSEGANGAFGMAWLDDGTIVYTQGAARMPALAKVSANGGASAVVWKSDTSRAMVLGPVGRTHSVLFSQCSILNTVGCAIAAIDLTSKKSSIVVPGATCARYAESGQLVYAQDGRLKAVGFDPGSLTVRGQPSELVDSVSRGALPFELSRSGTLVLRVDDGAGEDPFEMVWVDRSGRVAPVDTSWKFDVSHYAADHGWALSPDGSRLAIGLYSGGADQIWIKQLPHGPLSRVSTDPAPQVRPHWSRDGHAVNFLLLHLLGGLYQHRADGLGPDSALLKGGMDEGIVSPDGAWIIVRGGSKGSVQGGRDITGVRVGGDTARVPVIVTQFDEEAIALSPDGKWIAYQSDESGRTEVFVRSFPNTGVFKHQVSNGGGTAPLWSRDGRELFFVSAGSEMMTARVTAGSPLSVAAPVPLFHIAPELLRVEYAFYTPWDVAADGRFIMARARRTDAANAKTVVVAENWLTELKARVKQ